MAAETPEFGDEYRPEALTMAGVLDDLRKTPESLDWFVISPPGDFGPWISGEFRGEYRVGGDLPVVDAEAGLKVPGVLGTLSAEWLVASLIAGPQQPANPGRAGRRAHRSASCRAHRRRRRSTWWPT